MRSEITHKIHNILTKSQNNSLFQIKTANKYCSPDEQVWLYYSVFLLILYIFTVFDMWVKDMKTVHLSL